MRPKYLLALLLVLVASVMVSISASAAPAVNGFTGLVEIPTADALKARDFNVGVFVKDVGDDADRVNYCVNFGITDNFEVGLMKRERPWHDTTSINAKYMFMQEMDQKPAIAVGVVNITDTDDASVYVVGSRCLLRSGNGPRLHLGFGSGDELDGIFGGVSAELGDKCEVFAEYDTDDYNFGAKFAVSPALRVHVFLEDGSDFGVGMSFNHMQ